MIALSHHAETDSSPNPFINPSPYNTMVEMATRGGATYTNQPGLPGELIGVPRKKVAICGFEEQSVQTAPYDDPEWDVWGFNMANRMGFMRDREGRFRADAWFDLHEEHAQSAKDLAWINACPVPIYLTHQYGTNPLAIVLSLEDIQADILAQYGRQPKISYFASSFAYATALAIAMGYQTIGLFGVSLDWGRERVVERGNLEYWIGFAQGLGLDVQFSPNSKLLTHPGLYGIQYTQEKDGVEAACAEVMRQLLQSPGIRERLDAGLQERTRAMEQIRQKCANLVERIIYQSPGAV